METVILDLSGCKSLWDIHERIRVAFHFPDWYGKNWDAFFDLLRTECSADKVIIRGEHTIPKEYGGHLEIMHSCLDDLIAFRKKYEKYVNSPFSYIIEN